MQNGARSESPGSSSRDNRSDVQQSSDVDRSSSRNLSDYEDGLPANHVPHLNLHQSGSENLANGGHIEETFPSHRVSPIVMRPPKRALFGSMIEQNFLLRLSLSTMMS